jgi:sugar phosphate isomerase/epimerase
MMTLRQEDMRYEKHKKEIDEHMMSQLNNIYNDYVLTYKPETESEKRHHEVRKREFEELKRKFLEKRKLEEKNMKEFNEWYKKHREISDVEYIYQYEKYKKKLDEELKRKRLDVLPEIAGANVLDLPPPQRWRPVDEFAKEKAAETFANVAKYAYDEFTKKGKKAPIITVENVYPEWTLSRADSLKGMIKEAKKKFIKKLVKEEGLGKEEAKKIADKSLGVTWDVGHINQLRKYGYTEEDIIKETKKIAKHVKHLHITDNFGYADSHLAPGMGNVPIKKELAEIKKALGEKEYERVRKVIEAGGIWQHYKTSPTPYSVEGLNSPFYTYDQGPSWTNVRDIYSSYLFGYGNMLPDQHYKMRGAGFSLLPRELGGQLGGGNDKGRFAGS